MRLGLLVALLALAALAHGGSSLESLLTPSEKDAKGTTDKEILSEVIPGGDKAASAPADLVDDEVDDGDDADDDRMVARVAKSLARARRLRRQRRHLRSLLSRRKKTTKTTTTKKATTAATTTTAAATTTTTTTTTATGTATTTTAAPASYLSDAQKAELAHFQYDWRAIEGMKMSSAEVDELLRSHRDNDYLTPEEAQLLDHFGFNFRVIEEHGVPREEVDRRLSTLIREEHQRMQRLLPPPPARVPATTATTQPTVKPSHLSPTLRQALREFGYEPAELEHAGVSADAVRRVLAEQTQAKAREVGDELLQRIHKIDAAVRTDYDTRLEAALDRIKKVQDADRKVVTDSENLQSKAQVVVDTVLLKEKEAAADLTLEVAEKTRRIEEAAKAAEATLREKARARFAALDAGGREALSEVAARVKEEHDKAASVAVAAEQWYEQEELPFLRGLATAEAQRDRKLREEAQAAAQYRLLQLRHIADEVRHDH